MSRLELALPVIVGLLLTVGLTVISSVADAKDLQKQILGVGLSIIPIVVLWIAGRERIYRYSFWLYGIALFLLLLTLIMGKEVNGAKNWLVLGPLQFQPLEIAKMALILTTAQLLRDGYRGFQSYLAPVALLLPVLALVIKEDFGGAMVMGGTFICMLLVARIPLWHFAAAVVVLAIAFPLLIFPKLQPYQQERLTIFVNPSQDARGSGYHQTQSIIAIGSGGVTGKGYGRGTQTRPEYGFVYSQHADFVFASWAEEMGLVGSLLLLGLFAGLYWRLANMGLESPQLQDQLVFAGILGQIGVQSIENIGAALSMLPLTGITLPLISYGLTSLLSILTTLAIGYIIHRDRYESI